MRANFIVLDFDTAAYPFQAALASHVYRVNRLDLLHERWLHKTGKSELGYQDNLDLRAMMQKLPDDSLFYKIYHKWVAKVLAPHYGDRISYSAHPKMRVHLAGTDSVSGFHRDADVTGREDQINCYLPFTDVYDTCTLWCETEYGNKDYQPLNLKYGQALLWDGGMLEHGTVFNNTPVTRISCDFRFSVKEGVHVESPWCDVLSGRPAPI